MGRILGLQDVEAAIAGGSVFACGGGGWTEHGRTLGQGAVAIGHPELVAIDEVPDDAWVATAAAIGAPGGLTDWEMLGMDYVRAVQLLQQALGEPIYGLIIGQNGMSSTLNAWLPAAVLGLKVIDAVGDIRAHPTGDMGSLGLANSPTPMIQCAAGGKRAKHAYIELTVRGATSKVSPILRKAADMSGGFIASCRNPVRGGYVRQHAALGGISMAIDLGRVILAARPGGRAAIIEAICHQTGGSIIANGVVRRSTLRYTNDAFDIGVIDVADGDRVSTLHVMNEYMAVTLPDGTRLASYPDVITTLDSDGNPLSAGKLTGGTPVWVLHIPKRLLPLASSTRDPSVYPVVEEALGLDLAGYALT